MYDFEGREKLEQKLREMPLPELIMEYEEGLMSVAANCDSEGVLTIKMDYLNKSQALKLAKFINDVYGEAKE